ncbi:TetR/AcrR family transcriptional regulator [Mycobacterium sp.]|uniref:TetR/AcrR family transcriptional regulator n=1 Tax=Mycobacterium sp. TaxID=1785 RepID=UPI003D0C9753
MTANLDSGRRNQKQRTRTAILDAARSFVQSGAAPTMPAVAQKALVSEATAYRYFPDLAALIREALADVWPTAQDVMAPVSQHHDATRRIAFATEALMREVQAYEGAVRVMMSTTIARPADASLRPGRRFGLIDIALKPLTATLDADALAQLRRDLAVVASAEAYFTLIDLCGLTPDEAIASAGRTATTLVRSAAVGPDR